MRKGIAKNSRTNAPLKPGNARGTVRLRFNPMWTDPKHVTIYVEELSGFDLGQFPSETAHSAFTSLRRGYSFGVRLFSSIHLLPGDTPKITTTYS